MIYYKAIHQYFNCVAFIKDKTMIILILATLYDAEINIIRYGLPFHWHFCNYTDTNMSKLPNFELWWSCSKMKYVRTYNNNSKWTGIIS